METRPTDTCLWCGAPLKPSHRVVLYCCDHHRRKAQDARRKEERAEAKLRKRRGAGLMSDPFARRDLDAYTQEQIFANACLDPAPLVGPGDREETLAKRARRRQEARKIKKQGKGKGRKKKKPRPRLRQLSLLELPPVPEPAPLVTGRGWKKNWLSL